MDNETLLLKLNLQFFAKDGPGGEKTEPATSKKLNDIRKEGQVAKSKELITAVSLMSLFIILKIYLSKLGTGLIDVYTQVYNSISKVVDDSYNGLPIRTAGYYRYDKACYTYFISCYCNSHTWKYASAEMDGYSEAFAAKVQ